MTKLRLVCAAATLAAASSGTALAETTANVGIMSDYIFRGYYQAGATAFAGIDVEHENGAYFGAWGANLKDGLEYDLYAGYAGGTENFDWYAGLTGYYYTDEFDDSYEEINLGFSYGFLSIDYALGDYNAEGYSEKQTYSYIGATFTPNVGPYYFVGRTDYKNIGRDDPTMPGAGPFAGTGSNGIWFEIGKSFELMEDLELSVAALWSGDIPQDGIGAPSSVQLGPNCSDPGAISVGADIDVSGDIDVDDTLADFTGGVDGSFSGMGSFMTNANLGGCTSAESEYALTVSITKTLRMNN